MKYVQLRCKKKCGYVHVRNAGGYGKDGGGGKECIDNFSMCDVYGKTDSGTARVLDSHCTGAVRDGMDAGGYGWQAVSYAKIASSYYRRYCGVYCLCGSCDRAGGSCGAGRGSGSGPPPQAPAVQRAGRAG